VVDDGLVEDAFERYYAEFVHNGRSAPIPGAAEAIAGLRAAGRKVALVTGFARGTQDAIIEALGWQDIADLTLTPADAGRGRRADRGGDRRPTALGRCDARVGVDRRSARRAGSRVAG
jgi:phosphoglycolate phosphatase-like HAD superfamily hydrolase